MHVYTVKAGTPGKLLTQSPGMDITVEPYTTRKDLTFGDEQLIIDYVRFKNGNMKADSVATDLASRGYSIFCNDTINDRYLIAILAPAVTTL